MEAATDSSQSRHDDILWTGNEWYRLRNSRAAFEGLNDASDSYDWLARQGADGGYCSKYYDDEEMTQCGDKSN